jgi:hypothetical protein
MAVLAVLNSVFRLSTIRFLSVAPGYNGEVAEVKAYYGDISVGVDEFYR